MKIFSVNKLIWFLGLIIFGLLTCERPAIPDPQIVIIEPSLYDTIDSSSVTFIWVANEDAKEFSYSLDNIVWSDWFEDTTLSLHYLNEGEHTIWINARFSDIYESNNPLEVRYPPVTTLPSESNSNKAKLPTESTALAETLAYAENS